MQSVMVLDFFELDMALFYITYDERERKKICVLMHDTFKTAYYE